MICRYIVRKKFSSTTPSFHQTKGYTDHWPDYSISNLHCHEQLIAELLQNHDIALGTITSSLAKGVGPNARRLRDKPERLIYPILQIQNQLLKNRHHSSTIDFPTERRLMYQSQHYSKDAKNGSGSSHSWQRFSPCSEHGILSFDENTLQHYISLKE